MTCFISKNCVLSWKRHLSQEIAYGKHLWNFWKLLLSFVGFCLFIFFFFLFQFQTVYYTLANTIAKIEFYNRDHRKIYKQHFWSLCVHDRLFLSTLLSLTTIQMWAILKKWCKWDIWIESFYKFSDITLIMTTSHLLYFRHHNHL